MSGAGLPVRHRAVHQVRRSAWEGNFQEVHLVHAMATHPIVDQVTAEMAHQAKETVALDTTKHTMAALAVTTTIALTMTAVEVPAMIPTRVPLVVDINRTSLQRLGFVAVVEGVEDT